MQDALHAAFLRITAGLEPGKIISSILNTKGALNLSGLRAVSDFVTGEGKVGLSACQAIGPDVTLCEALARRIVSHIDSEYK